MPIPSCQEAKLPAFLVPAAKLPGFQVPGIWQYGVILYAREAIWTIWSLFPPFPRLWGTPKIIKNRDFLAPCCHTAKTSRNYIICYICTMLACYQKHQNIDIFAFKVVILGASVHILAFWSARMLPVEVTRALRLIWDQFLDHVC